MSNRLLGVEDLEQILGRKATYCYKVMRELNSELKEKGYYTTTGKIPEKYFYQRIGINYDGKEEQ